MADSRPDGGWITVNGARRPLPDSGSLVRLLGDLGIPPDAPAVAVAVNDRIVPRGAWDTWRLTPDDRVEIVKPIQGG